MKSLFCIALCLTIGLCATPAVHAAEFSADIVRTADGQPLPGGKAYVKNGKIRMEASVNGQQQVMITDPTAGKVYMMLPAAKRCMEMNVDPSQMGPEALKNGRNDLGQWRTVGHESLDGWDCEKRVFDFKDKSKGDMTAWFADKLGYPIKSEVTEKGKTMSMEYKNIKTGTVDASLFSVPGDYQKMTMPAMNPGMKPGAPSGKGTQPGM